MFDCVEIRQVRKLAIMMELYEWKNFVIQMRRVVDIDEQNFELIK